MKTNNDYEHKFWSEGFSCVVGLDEAGRGPIAGPLVVAGVIFPKDFDHEEIYDSKKLTEKKREQLYEEIIHKAIAYRIFVIEPKEIDRLNIYRATQKAMEDIVKSMDHVDKILSDAMPLKGMAHEVISLVKGDQKSVSIAAASILAKVTRDRIMYEYDALYPEYGFKNHKGYPTKRHLSALETYGVLPIHRESYGPVAAQKQIKFTF